jgi:hypothetical protein
MTCESKPVGRATGAMDIELLDNRCYGRQVAELYNENRPHRSLEGLTPREFAVQQALIGVANSQT